MKICFSALFCLIISGSFAQNHDSVIIRSIATEILTGSKAYENLKILCKEVGPRLSGSAQADKAVKITRDMLTDAGADTVWLQPCTLNVWQRGKKESGFIIKENNTRYPLALCALGNSVPTPANGLEAEIIEVSDVESLHRISKNIKGKIVFFNQKMNPANINTFQSYRESGGARRSGAAQAAKYGAVGVMVRSLSVNIDPYPHTGATQYNDSFPKIPAVGISTKDAEWLHLELKNRNKVRGSIAVHSSAQGEKQSFNVIAEITGSEYPDEKITFGAHLDSWDLGEGAHDDGAGCVQGIELIRAFKSLGMQPKRSVRVVLFMNEENGSAGSKAYHAFAKENKEQIPFALESDAGGFTPRAISVDMDENRMEIVKNWLPLLEPYGITHIYPGGGGADINRLKDLGTALAGFAPDSQRYFDIHHAATDVFEAVSKRELELGTAGIAAIIWLVSEYGL